MNTRRREPLTMKRTTDDSVGISTKPWTKIVGLTAQVTDRQVEVDHDRFLLGFASAPAIHADIETESGVPWKPLSVHSGEHRALCVDVIVNLNG